MNRFCSSAMLAGLIVAAAAPGAWAQLEVPSAELVAQSRSRIPRLAAETRPAAYAAYLKEFLGPGTKDVVQDRAVVTAVRLADDISRVNASDSWMLQYAVQPMSGQMRLPETYPLDGRLNEDIRVVLAQDEYEPASFVVFPLDNVERVQLRVGELKTADGTPLPANAVDLKVVKVWYQNGNAWTSYFQDVGSVLVPELLVHDENLIRVDTAKQANYARVGQREVWLNKPFRIDSGFDPISENFADAETLLPVKFETGKGKQFLLTVHAAPDTVPGTYRGRVSVSAPGRKEVLIPLAITVLPFKLPAPRANFDTKREFVVSLMSAWPRTPADHPATMATLLNFRRHNLLNPPLYMKLAPTPELDSAIDLYKQAGFSTSIVFGGLLPFGGANNQPPVSYAEMKRMEKAILDWRRVFRGAFPNADIYTTGGDEQGVRWFARQRPVWRLAHELGLKTGIAGHTGSSLTKAGYALDLHTTAGSPGDKDHSAPWNQLKTYTGFYANQHNGSENPDFVRRQHGLLGYLSNYDMVNNYEFAWGPWNDFGKELYKPMALAYPTATGLVDTLAWEGFREGIDDIRYATQLRILAEEAAASDSVDRQIEARKCWAWFAQLDGVRMDLDQIHLEMIEKILKFQSLKGGAQ